jgi:hypothetical protein
MDNNIDCDNTVQVIAAELSDVVRILIPNNF